MAGPDDKTLDALESLTAEKLRMSLGNGNYESAGHLARALANIALYRRLMSGAKLRVRADGTADVAEVPR